MSLESDPILVDEGMLATPPPLDAMREFYPLFCFPRKCDMPREREVLFRMKGEEEEERRDRCSKLDCSRVGLSEQAEMCGGRPISIPCVKR